MKQVIERNHTVYSTEEFREFTRYVQEQGGRVIGTFSLPQRGITVKYEFEIGKGDDE